MKASDGTDEGLILPLVLYLSSARLWNENKSSEFDDIPNRTDAYHRCLDDHISISVTQTLKWYPCTIRLNQRQSLITQSILNTLTELFPKVQFICASHSPFIIQSLKKGQLISMDGDVLQPRHCSHAFHKKSNMLQFSFPDRVRPPDILKF